MFAIFQFREGCSSIEHAWGRAREKKKKRGSVLVLSFL